MGKLLYLILFVIAIQVSEVMIMNNTASPVTGLYTLFTDPSSFQNLSLFNMTTTALLAVGAGLIIGSFVFKTDTILFTGIATTFLSFGLGLIPLWNDINSSGFFGDATGLFASFIVGPILVCYFMVILEFWRGRD